LQNQKLILYNTMKYIILLALGLSFQSCHSNPVVPLDTSDYPAVAKAPDFKKLKEDTLSRLAQFDKYPGSDEIVGVLSGMAIYGNNVYLADYQRGKIIVLDKDNFKFQFSFGNGPGNGPGDLNSPFVPFLFKKNVVVPQYGGHSLLSIFSSNGEFLKDVPRKSFDFNISPDPHSAFIDDSVIYFSNVIARDLGKVSRYDVVKDHFMDSHSIVPVSDFTNLKDSAKQSIALTKLFLIQNDKKDKFYAVQGNKPLVNVYSNTGKLISSVDLRGIPLINDYYHDLNTLMQADGITYFTSAVSDEKNNIYLFASRLPNVKNFTEHKPGAEKLDVIEYLVVFNLEKSTYSLYKTENRGFVPLMVVAGQLWSFDRTNSQLVIHQLKTNIN